MEISPFSQIIWHNKFSVFEKSLLGLVQEINRNFSLIFHCAVITVKLGVMNIEAADHVQLSMKFLA